MSSFIFLFSFTLDKLPQMIISTVFVGSISYFILFHLDNPLHDFIQSISSNQPPEQNGAQNDQHNHHHHHILLDIFFTLLEYINGVVMRRICICVFFILPILMEMKALIVLSSLVTDGVKKTSFLIGLGICWVIVMIELILFLPMHFKIEKTSSSAKTNNPSGSKKWEHGTYPFGSITLKLKDNTTLFDIRVHSWIYLYSVALLTTTIMVQKNQIHKPIILAAPFLLATGSFLILSCRQKERGMDGLDNDNKEGDLFLNIFRRALSRTLFDVLQLVGEDIAEDDKLQLNMLQWIVEYWATPCDDNSDNGRDSSTSASSTAYRTSQRSNSGSNFANESDGSSSPVVESAQTGDSWVGLNSSSSSSSIDIHRNSRHSNTNTNSNSNDQSSASSSNMYSTQLPKTKSKMKFPSFANIDERARPAVLSYKKAVEEFPPSRNTCIVLAISKRCPALLSIASLHLSWSHNAIYVTIILLPMIILEFMRISEWMNACHRATTYKRLHDSNNDPNSSESFLPSSNDATGFLLPNDMESMEILLSIDSYLPFNPCSSLQVWMNVKSSISGLEASLTAVKCVHTANIATDVVFDAMSLASLGLEVKKKGLSHGINLLGKDLFQFHLEKAMKNSRGSNLSEDVNDTQDHHHQSFSKSAINLVNNSKTLSKNFGELLEDGNKENNILHPLISGASIVIGKGWLWDKDDKNASDSNAQENVEYDDSGCIERDELKQSQTESGNNIATVSEPVSVKIRHKNQKNKDCSDMAYDDDLAPNEAKEEEDENQSHEDTENVLNSISEEENQNDILTKDILHTAKIISETETVEECQNITDLDTKSQESLLHATSNTENIGNEDNNNNFNLLGAGLAVIAGAAVSAIALAKKSDDERKKVHTNSRSTLTIERLDGEE